MASQVSTGDQQINGQQLDVRQFGARGDGQTDDTDAFQAALAEAAKRGGAVHVPSGTFRVRLSSAGVQRFTGVKLSAGCQLVGDGVDRTIIRAIGESADPSWESLRLILVDRNTRLADMTIDGDKEHIDRGKFHRKAAILVRTLPDVEQAVFENLRVINGFADGEAEGFGLSVTKSRNCTVRNVEAFDNDGSGIAIGGDVYETTASDIVVDNVRTYRNGWQGVALYGARKVTVTHAEAYENYRNGLNAEWCDDITFRDCESHDNRLRGLRVAGFSHNIHYENVASKHNGASAGNGAELIVEPQPFAKANPKSGVQEVGVPQNITVSNCALEPASGKPHVLFNMDVEAVNIGTSAPQGVVIDSDGAENWQIRANRDETRLAPGVVFPRLAKRQGVAIDPSQAARGVGAEVGGVTMDRQQAGPGARPHRQGARAGERRAARADRGHQGQEGDQEHHSGGLLGAIENILGLDTDHDVNAHAAAPAPQGQSSAPSGPTPGAGAGKQITINQNGGFIDIPQPGAGRYVCHLRYRIATPATWLFMLRDPNTKDSVREIRQEAKANTNDTQVWFESDLLPPPGMSGQYVLRVQCGTDGTNTLEMETVQFTPL